MTVAVVVLAGAVCLGWFITLRTMRDLIRITRRCMEITEDALARAHHTEQLLERYLPTSKQRH